MLLDNILADSRRDMSCLGTQLMVARLALAALGFMHPADDRASPQAAAALRDVGRYEDFSLAKADQSA